MRLIVFAFLLAVACTPNAPTGSKAADPSPVSIQYDSVKAKQWGADDRGMKAYVLVFLKRGPSRSKDSTTRAQLQSAHMANIGKLAEQGKLVLAGPMLTDEDIRGIYLFDVPTVEEARRLTETDPAVQAGALIMEMHPWYGSAAVMDVPRLHKLISKKDF